VTLGLGFTENKLDYTGRSARSVVRSRRTAAIESGGGSSAAGLLGRFDAWASGFARSRPMKPAEPNGAQQPGRARPRVHEREVTVGFGLLDTVLNKGKQTVSLFFQNHLFVEFYIVLLSLIF